MSAGTESHWSGQLTFELESRIGGDDRGETPLAVSVVRRADEVGLLSQGELRDAFIPSSDDPVAGERQLSCLIEHLS